jgi:uncharacterized protein
VAKRETTNEGCEVFVPQFPSPPVVPAKIAEWFEVLNGYKNFNADTILIGHSLGGLFALRVLEKLEHPIKATLFVGTPLGIRPLLNYDRDNSFCGFYFDWESIRKKAKHYVVFHSDDDPYVDLENGTEPAKQLDIMLDFISSAGHFNTKAGYTQFEELKDKVLEILHKKKK